MKKFISLLIIITLTCTGCALAAGMLAGGIAGEVIDHTIGGGKGKEKVECSTCLKYPDRPPCEETPKEGSDHQKDVIKDTTQR
jgi:hypothetical protein